jgi:hypothetical protein
MGWAGKTFRQKGGEPALEFPHRIRPLSVTAQFPHSRTESHTIFFVSLLVDAIKPLQSLNIMITGRGMKTESEATTGEEGKSPKVDSGTRGREFESPRPDHFS